MFSKQTIPLIYIIYIYLLYFIFFYILRNVKQLPCSLITVHYETCTKCDKTHRTRYVRVGWLVKNDICSSWAAWLKAELRQACIRHPTVGTALHIYKQLIIKELYVALQNIRGLIALCSLRAGRACLYFFSSFLTSGFYFNVVWVDHFSLFFFLAALKHI